VVWFAAAMITVLVVSLLHVSWPLMTHDGTGV
jgi:hypothetical protein